MMVVAPFAGLPTTLNAPEGQNRGFRYSVDALMTPLVNPPTDPMKRICVSEGPAPRRVLLDGSAIEPVIM